MRPGRRQSPGIPRLQQSKRIGSLEEKLSTLMASRNWFRNRDLWTFSYFKKHKIIFPYPWKAPDVPSLFQCRLRLTIPPSTQSTRFRIASPSISILIQTIDVIRPFTSSFRSRFTHSRALHPISSVILCHFPAPSSFERNSAMT
jgi:hypothetical protein